MRTCTKCSEKKDEMEFNLMGRLRKNGTPDRRSHCKICVAKHQRQWIKKNRCIIALQNSRAVARRCGVTSCNATPGELEVALTDYCAICGVPEIECSTRLHMDHDHRTGDFRGWLCNKCNRMLGLGGNSPEILERGAMYLRNCETVTT